MSTVTVHFADASTGNPTSWDLDFGDGSPHGTALPTDHVYDLTAVGAPYQVTATLAVTLGTYTVSTSKDIDLLFGQGASINEDSPGVTENGEGVTQ